MIPIAGYIVPHFTEILNPHFNFFTKRGIFLETIGIICEYNPFHLGHWKQLRQIKSELGADTAIVCLMSGNFVQRGMPAIFDKAIRAEAALRCGADLVLELPTTYALRSAEGFAAGGVEILSKCCNKLCFGSETGDAKALIDTARVLLAPEFSNALRRELDKGLSFPAARQQALSAMGISGDLLANPNDILAVEYCKAILAQGSTMSPWPIRREGSYHATTPDPENPSATALRALVEHEKDFSPFVPPQAQALFENAPVHTLAAGEKAILYRLRTMTDEEFEALPYGSEGLWRKLMHAARSCATLEEIATTTKSKRYTRTRIDRMILCATLGITAPMLSAPTPYVRVLGFTEKGTAVLKKLRKAGDFPHIGEKTAHPYEALERKWDDLYGLFATSAPEAPGTSYKRRVCIR